MALHEKWSEEAIVGLECALAAQTIDVEIREQLVDLYRKLEIDRFLISRAAVKLGLLADDYRGFDNCGSMPSSTYVRARARELVGGACEGAQIRTKVLVDQAAFGEIVTAEDFKVERAVGEEAISAHSAVAQLLVGMAHDEQALKHARAAEDAVMPDKQMQRLLGRLELRLGHYARAAAHLDIATIASNTYWFTHGGASIGKIIANVDEYCDYNIYYRDNRLFPAVIPESAFLAVEHGEARLLINRVPKRLRIIVRKIAPRPILNLMRRIAHSRLLKPIIIHEAHSVDQRLVEDQGAQLDQ